jgi:hypothetical protein
MLGRGIAAESIRRRHRWHTLVERFGRIDDNERVAVAPTVARSRRCSVGASTMSMSCSYNASAVPARISEKYSDSTTGSVTAT